MLYGMLTKITGDEIRGIDWGEGEEEEIPKKSQRL